MVGEFEQGVVQNSNGSETILEVEHLFIVQLIIPNMQKLVQYSDETSSKKIPGNIARQAKH